MSDWWKDIEDKAKAAFLKYGGYSGHHANEVNYEHPDTERFIEGYKMGVAELREELPEIITDIVEDVIYKFSNKYSMPSSIDVQRWLDENMDKYIKGEG